jgi:hypothetical protein
MKVRCTKMLTVRLYLYSFHRAQGGELRRKGTRASQLYRLPYAFPPTNTSTVARSSGFQVALLILALVFSLLSMEPRGVEPLTSAVQKLISIF